MDPAKRMDEILELVKEEAATYDQLAWWQWGAKKRLKARVKKLAEESASIAFASSVLASLVGHKMGSSEKTQEIEDSYAIKYLKKSDDSFIGYHLGTFCQTTPDIANAKRYSGDPLKQMSVIADNLRSVLDQSRWGGSDGIKEKIALEYFYGLTIDDIYLDFEDVSTLPPQTLKITEV